MEETNKKSTHPPQEISMSEWREILGTRRVQDAFEIPLDEPEEKLIPALYGAKFLFEDSDQVADLIVRKRSQCSLIR